MKVLKYVMYIFLVHPSRVKQQQVGFTMFELLVVVAIVAILASLAAPSFRTVIVNNEVNSTATSLLADLNLARSEALKRGVSMTACVSTSTTACADSGNWENGWIIFIDRDADNSRDVSLSAGEELVKVKQEVPQSFQIVTTSGTAVKTIRFDRTGATSSRGLKLTPTDTSINGRAICIATTGRIRLTEQGTETC